MADLRVDTDQAFNTAQAVGNHAVELHDELQQIAKDWDNMSQSWEGVAASAYQPVWEQWHENATKVTKALMESSQRLAQAAVAYQEQDQAGAQTVNSTMDIGL